ncbi:MAG: hypothetical protein RJR37_04330 [Peptococcaceae bacterium MAG4]|nr:hypothetical protein [Peptococcaceae bacterium MAG4]
MPARKMGRGNSYGLNRFCAMSRPGINELTKKETKLWREFHKWERPTLT